MNLFHSCSYICVLTLIPLTILSQNLPEIIPPAPNAASLGKYGEYPVSTYTGVPKVSVPITTLKSGDLEIPINLSYHSSGIKVSEEASWVGLGWSLNAGGVITRQIRDSDDFESHRGYIGEDELIDFWPETYKPDIQYSIGLECQPIVYNDCVSYNLVWTGTNNHVGNSKIDEYASTLIDSQPDRFFYNFLGYSGELIFEKQTGVLLKAKSVEQNNLSFIYNSLTEQWEVTDGKGWKYFFWTVETTQSLSRQIHPEYDPNSSWTQAAKTSWYLDRISSPSGDEITFEYDYLGLFESIEYYDQNGASRDGPDFGVPVGEPKIFNINGESGFYSNPINYTNSNYIGVRTRTHEVILSKINVNNGYLDFVTTNRLDRPRATINNTNYSKGLSEIKLFNLNNKIIKTWDFEYSYFNQDKINFQDKEFYLRLKLDSVTESFIDNNSIVEKPSLKFNYNSVELPKKNSRSIDHWGYYNGAMNENIPKYSFFYKSNVSSTIVNDMSIETASTIIPRILFIGTQSGKDLMVYMGGANREADEMSAQAGILTKIEYPTGGETRFNYELNKFSGSDIKKEEHVNYEVNSLGIDDKEFTLYKKAFVFLDFDLHNYLYQADPNNTTIMWNMDSALKRKVSSNNYEDVVRFRPATEGELGGGPPSGNNNTDEMHARKAVALEPGTYKIVVDNGGVPQLDLSLKAKIVTEAASNQGGGLRIKDMVNYVDSSEEKATKKSYRYYEGKLMTPIVSFYNETDLYRNYMSDPRAIQYCCNFGSFVYPVPQTFNYIKTFGNSIVPLGNSALGNPVGYSRVVVDEGESYDVINTTITNSTVFNYLNSVDDEFGPGSFFPNLPTKRLLSNGKLKQERYYKGSYYGYDNYPFDTLVRKVVYHYDKEESSSLSLKGVLTMKPSTPYITLITQVSGSKAFATLQQPNFFLETVINFAHFYEVNSEWWFLDKVEETYFDTEGNNPITSITNYFYDNPIHKELSRSITNSSDGKIIETQNLFPDDIKTASTLQDNSSINGGSFLSVDFNAIERMKESDLHQIILPVQIETTVKDINNTLLSSSIIRTTYSEPYSNKILPKEIQTLESISSTDLLENRIIFHSYYDTGKVKEVSMANGPKTNYYWGYNQSYPVIKLENSELDLSVIAESTSNLPVGYSSLESLLLSLGNIANDSQQKLRWKIYNENLRAALPNSMMTTYTYNPLIGVTSMTDPKGYTVYYEYDGFNRLEHVKDAEGNILSKNEYNYKN